MMSAPAGGAAAMNLRSLSCIVGIVLIAGCAGDVADPTSHGSQTAGRWISLWVENAGEPDHHLSVVDDRDLTRVVGIADPATVPGHTTMRVRIFVPDDIPWMVRFNELLLLTPDHAAGFCGTLPVTIHVNWSAGSVEVPIWMGEAPGFPGRPPDNCDAAHREVLRVPSAP
jgi:hypothetical protein